MEEQLKIDPLLTRREAAKYMNFSCGTLAVWDSVKRYNLSPIKVGRSVRYRKSALDKFLEEREFSAG